MPSYHSFLKSGSADLPRLEILRSPITVLIATSETQKVTLADLGISTVFDLGANTVFAIASLISAASRNENAINKSGFKSNDWFQPGTPELALEQCAEADISLLRCLTSQQAKKMKEALAVSTIRELALWPQYIFARELVSEELGGTLFTPQAQAVEGDELVPRFGEFPTERVYYDNLVMLQSPAQDIPHEEITKPISVKDALARAASGGSKPAVGAIITVAQSWYAQGVTLGQMLHSLALAPGESTRIAVVDWQRKTRASITETTSETEALDTASEHSRAMSEVQSGVASEMQSGGATSTVSSVSESTANQNTSGGVSVDVLGWIMGSGEASAGVSDSSTAKQSAKSTTQGKSASWSLGTRSTMAQMSQRVNDSTQQHSTSVRNRRASAVREVSQSENESITTRVVANYNHMHALTVQYYEVVQIYRTDTSVNKAERCLFIPFEAMTFDDELIDRFRRSLTNAALSQSAFSLLTDDTTAVTLTFSEKSPIVPSWLHAKAIARLPFSFVPAPTEAPTGTQQEGTQRVPAQPTVNDETRLVLKVWDQNAVAQIARITGRGLFRPGSKNPSLPDDTEWTQVTFSGIAVSQLRIQKSDETINVDVTNGSAMLPASLRLIDIIELSVTKKEKPAASGTMTMTMSYLGRRFPLDAIPVELPEDATAGIFHSLVKFSNDRENRKRKLLEHLNSNRDHYTRSVLSTLDSTSVAALLSGYQWNNRPLIDVVEPRPYTVAGNYVVFRAPCDGDELSGVKDKDNIELTWEATLFDRQITGQPSDSRLIPIPTSGVFAEAVLGRSNSAEKLDITRFWNWQDSPIPLQAPEIAAIQAGSRGQAEDLRTGQLGQPVLNIVNPTSLPDPAGLGATLSALQNGNMFRDMSGLAQLMETMKSAQQTTTSAATDAGQIASANMRASMQKQVALAQVAADVVKTVATKGVASGGGSQGISAEGAKINHGRDMDGRGNAKSVNNHTGGPTPNDRSNTTSPKLGSSSPRSLTNGTNDGTPNRNELEAFRNSVHGALGASGSDILGNPTLNGEPKLEKVGLSHEDNLLISKWLDLINFTVPPSLAESLAKRQMKQQNIFQGYGDINLDHYSLAIRKLPTIGGSQWTMNDLYKHIRLNINDFIDTTWAKFSPYDAEKDGPIWRSSNPYGSVIAIDMGGPDNGDVVTSFSENSRWRFTTVRTDNFWSGHGSHPVSGTREFGYRIEGSEFVFYIKGADSTTEELETWMSSIAFGVADKLWRSFLAKTVKFINDNGGSAEKETSFARRFKKDDILVVKRFQDEGLFNNI